MGVFDDIGNLGAKTVRAIVGDGEVADRVDKAYDKANQDFGDEVKDVGDHIVDFGDWCGKNPLQCALSGADFLPVVGTLARCGQLAVQSVEGEVGEDTAFNCQLNLAGDLIPVAGKGLSKGFKAATKIARGSKAAKTLKAAETAAAKDGLTKAEKEAAQIKLGEAGEAYAKVVAREAERVDAEIAAEALEIEAHNAAILEKEQFDAFTQFAEKRAARMEANEAEVRALLKEAQGESKAAVKAAEKEEVKIAEKAEADAADAKAARRGERENAIKDAKPKKTVGGRLKSGAKAVVENFGATVIAEPLLSIGHCRYSLMADVVLQAGEKDEYGDKQATYKRNPVCANSDSESESESESESSDDGDPIPPGGTEDRNQPMLHPDLWPSLVTEPTAAEAGYDNTGVYVLLGMLAVIAGGTYAYYKF